MVLCLHYTIRKKVLEMRFLLHKLNKDSFIKGIPFQISLFYLEKIAKTESNADPNKVYTTTMSRG